MQSKDFLKAIWPENGLYALATLFVPKGSDKAVFAHKVFENIDDAVRYVERSKDTLDLYFCIHSLKKAKVWNTEKIDYKTGEKGAYEIRTQRNMLEARAFFFDLDVGESTKALSKYATQSEAAQDLIRFCKATSLPKPLVTSSGGGLHVYWVVNEAIDSETWRGHASTLRQLAKHHGLKADPARTTDTSSVLRVAGTFNFKNRSAPRPVKVMVAGTSTPTGEFLKLLSDAAIRAGVTAKPAQKPTQQSFEGLGTNLTQMEFDGPPVAFKSLVSACGQMAQIVRSRGDVSEPQWYHSINLVRFVQNGRKFAHKISEGHPDYNFETTEAKLDQLESKGIKPTSCLRIADEFGDEACEGCPFRGKVKSPIVAARFKDSAPAPVKIEAVDTDVIETAIPDAPYPYKRLSNGHISKTMKTKEGDEVTQVFYRNDLYPVRRISNEQAKLEYQTWRVVLPNRGAKDFELDADALYDRGKFVTAIANQGIYPEPGNIQIMQDYMIAYISELQRLSAADTQHVHLGWTKNLEKFVLPDKILLRDGTAKPVMLDQGAINATNNIHKRGTLEKQVELLRFYNKPAYIPHQLFMLSSLASPFFYATGHHGIVVNATGESGASKSTALYTAASFWGQPEMYAINGTTTGATAKARNERVTTYANLPICVDEITNLPQDDVVDMAMGITQPGHRIRLDTKGRERKPPEGYKSTILMSTANTSLHSLLSNNNATGTAGSMRVFELQFLKLGAHTKGEADDYLHELRSNYGWIGEIVMRWAMQHIDEVEQRIRERVRRIDAAADVQPSERFHSGYIATCLVMGEIAVALGLLSFNIAQIEKWAIEVQIPQMRGIITEQYVNPLGILTNYLEHINGDIIIINRPEGMTNITNVVRTPRGHMKGHYDVTSKTMWVLKKEFKDYCSASGADAAKILADLAASRMDVNGNNSRIVPQSHIRKVLGAGTEYAKAQSWCFTINMAHTEVSGAVDLKVITGGKVEKRLLSVKDRS